MQRVSQIATVAKNFTHPLTFFHECGYNTPMANYDELLKHITGEFPRPLAALALKTPHVEVGARLNTEHITFQRHHSDMTFHVSLPDEVAIMQKSPFYEHVLQRGVERGIEQGIEQGIAAAYQQWQEWNARRMAAEAKGEPFNEPPPTPPENGDPTK